MEMCSQNAHPRRRRILVVVLVLVILTTIGVIGRVVWLRRLELFVLPEMVERLETAEESLREISQQRLPVDATREERDARSRRFQEILNLRGGAFTDLVRVQHPDFPTEVSVQALLPARTLSGKSAQLATLGADSSRGESSFWLPGPRTSLFVLAIDSSGVVSGKTFPCPNTMCMQGAFRLRDAPRTYDVFSVTGYAASSLFAIDRNGVVPMGLWFDAFWDGGEDERDPFRSVGFPVSTMVSTEAREWILFDTRKKAGVARIDEMLESKRVGDLFRALYEIERQGPEASKRAVPLLGHSSPDLRARAVAVCGNDPTLGRQIWPRAGDPDVRVRLAARFALLGADNLELAQRAFAALLRNKSINLGNERVALSFDRLWTHDTVAELLDRTEADSVGLAGELGCHGGEAPTTYPSSEILEPFAARLIERRRVAIRRFVGIESEEADTDTLRIIPSEIPVLTAWVACAGGEAAESLIDELLGNAVRRRNPGDAEDDVVGEFGLDFDEVLFEGLHARTSPLTSPESLSSLATLATWDEDPGDWNEADLAMKARYLRLLWNVPGARESFVDSLKIPERREAVYSYHRPFGLDGDEDEDSLRWVPAELLSTVRAIRPSED